MRGYRLKMATEHEEIKILTLNAWGLHYFAKNIKERFDHIADEMIIYDIVCLQEVWSDSDYRMLSDSVRSELPYSTHYPSGIIGSGLCIFSRYPIMNVFHHEYRVTHTLKNFSDGEKFAKKGVLAARIELPLSLGFITVFNTHINYGRRNNQFAELMQFMSNIAHNSPVILCGDFNTEANHHCYSVITKVLKLSDAFIDDPQPTCDLPGNLYSKSKPSCPTGKRLDYVFYSSEAFDNNCSLEVKSHRLSLSGNIPTKGFPYSDHEGLEVVFNIIPPKTGPFLHDVITEDSLRSLDAMADEINNELVPLQRIYESKNKHLMLLWILLVLVSLAVSVLMVLPSVYNGLSSWYLQILCSLIPSASWMISMFIFFHTLDSVHMMRGMIANYRQVNLLIDHNRNKQKRNNY